VIPQAQDTIAAIPGGSMDGVSQADVL
jgi:hypothetical protein